MKSENTIKLINIREQRKERMVEFLISLYLQLCGHSQLVHPIKIWSCFSYSVRTLMYQFFIATCIYERTVKAEKTTVRGGNPAVTFIGLSI